MKPVSFLRCKFDLIAPIFTKILMELHSYLIAPRTIGNAILYQGGAKMPIFFMHISEMTIAKNMLWKLKMIIQTNVSKTFFHGGSFGGVGGGR